MTVLGGGGAWPTPERGCSGYLIEAGGFRLLVDPGYATVPRLLELVGAADIDAVFVTHGHADHCADLNPLLRARHLDRDPPTALPVHALPGAADAVLALDGPMLTEDFDLREFAAGDEFAIGPFEVQTRSLQHFVPNVGVRLTVGTASLAYTGDGGASSAVVELAQGADVLLAEATYSGAVPEASRGSLSNAEQAGQHAADAGVGQLVLAHLWPGTGHDEALRRAGETFGGPVSVAVPGLVVDLG